ncbi:uncharacterized protein LOC105437850 [Strongylocentrotus purpuratus]|uniref:Uncharacterized protein n=1 Tax=Strongylocentrotus purpuratus TaxID=7668 RepID=A0A7M7NIJ7_STRPU|nr:uncharacterized protein LOC105437850 [Strongylocentrotus purpuratus]
MGLFRVIVYGLEITALVAIVGLSIAVATVMGLLKADFDGGCPLYPTFTGWFIKLNDVSNCNFVIGMNSVAIFVAIIAGVYRLVELVKQKKMVSRCIDFQQQGAIPPFDATHFHDYLLTAEMTAWLSFAMWISLSAFTVFISVCCKNKM